MPDRQAEIARRIIRLRALEAPGMDAAARAAMEDYWAAGHSPTAIKVRHSFVARQTPLPGEVSDRRPPARSTAPPAARLVRSHGVGLRTALMGLFVAQCSTGKAARLGGLVIDPVDASVGWRHLVLAAADSRPDTVQAVTPMDNRIRQIKAAFDLLARPEVGLIELPRAGTPKRRYEDVRLLHEGGVRSTGAAPEYRLPRDDEATISVPVGFFTNGWVHVLDDAEIAAWLMFRHRCAVLESVATSGVELPGVARLTIYGQARTAWDRHKSLTIMGLMRHEADDRRRADGTVEEFPTEGPGSRHRFWVVDEPLGKVALHSVLADFSAALDDPFGPLGVLRFSRPRTSVKSGV